MSTDIIERLRLNAKGHTLDINQAVLDEVAGNIERLRARVAEFEALRAAVDELDKLPPLMLAEDQILAVCNAVRRLVRGAE